MLHGSSPFATKKMANKIKYLIGIDEVGRGCLAGPIAVTALVLPLKFKVASFKFKVPLRDSKKLSAAQRERWAEHAKNHPQIFYATAYVYPKAIERINISQAANLAATRCVKRLMTRNKKLMTNNEFRVLLDGGLFIGRSLVSSHKLSVRTVVRGDEKFNCIKLASIVAKVSRDRAMRRLHRKFPEYGLDQHKGYGTSQHVAAIKKHGPSPIHRLTFIGNLV